MDILLNDIGKRYRSEWIFKKVSLDFLQGNRYAILGPNGAGKSTFLKVLSGHLTPSKGKITFRKNGNSLDIDQVYPHISYAAPYIELIEEFTLLEALVFHQRFKPFLPTLSPEKMVDILQFQSSRHKPIKFFSSGMKQRLKLVLALCSNTPILLLDEPTTNLDAQGSAWYRDLVINYAADRLVIIASNVEADYDFCCDKTVNILTYK